MEYRQYREMVKRFAKVLDKNKIADACGVTDRTVHSCIHDLDYSSRHMAAIHHAIKDQLHIFSNQLQKICNYHLPDDHHMNSLARRTEAWQIVIDEDDILEEELAGDYDEDISLYAQRPYTGR